MNFSTQKAKLSDFDTSQLELDSIAVHHALSDAESDWTNLIESGAPHSIYQTPLFIAAWAETLGRATDSTPMICVAYDKCNIPLVLFPFSLNRKHGLVMAEYAGGTHANVNIPLIRPGTYLNSNILKKILQKFAALSRIKPDVFVLRQQSKEWHGQSIPFPGTRVRTNPHARYSDRLSPDPKDFFAQHFSKESLRKLKQKRLRLEKSGPVTHHIALTESDIALAMDAFFQQKLARFNQQGIQSDFEHPSARVFLETLARRSLPLLCPRFELHTLKLGERIVAVCGIGMYQKTGYAMVISFDLELSALSPGHLLLHGLSTHLCKHGFVGLDMGAGNATYKQRWCHATETLYDTLAPITLKRRAFSDLSIMLFDLRAAFSALRNSISCLRKQHFSGRLPRPDQGRTGKILDGLSAFFRSP
jgi:CelD/BcsL family acetyltransferase involved in cellulose biosynthesis